MPLQENPPLATANGPQLQLLCPTWLFHHLPVLGHKNNNGCCPGLSIVSNDAVKPPLHLGIHFGLSFSAFKPYTVKYH